MNLLDFQYLKENLDTNNLYGSDTCLANLFLLRQKYNIWLKVHNNVLFRYYHGEKNNTGYGFPLPMKSISSTDWLQSALQYIIENSKDEDRPLCFCFITDEQKKLLEQNLKLLNKHIEWHTNRNDSDYIYLQKNLSNLPGMAYQKKRNHIARFKRFYENTWSFKSFPENQIANDILKISEIWYNETSDFKNLSLQQEQDSIKEAIKNAETLNITGGVLYINEEPVAMTLASPVSNSTLDIIYEKAINKYKNNGAYAMINQQFAIHNQSYTLINREEDLGIEGLRKAKLSYKPEIILDKYYGTVID